MREAAGFLLVGGIWTSAKLMVDGTDVGDDTEVHPDFKGEAVPQAVRRFHVRGGRREDDYVECGPTPLTLVSQEWVAAMTAAAISGWRTYEIELERRNGWPRKQYFGLMIKGRCGPIDNSRSPRVPRISPHSGKRSDVYLGLYFDEGTWDGSDLFVPTDDTAYLFATPRVEDVAEAKHLKGMSFQPIERVERFML